MLFICFKQERSDHIRKSCTMLNDERLTPEQFLDRITHICTKKYGKLTNVMEIISENNNDADIEESFADLSVCEQPEQDQIEQEDPKKGTCISCRSAQCDIILIPCYHIVVCSQCWKSQVESHEQQCRVKFKNNKRKEASEKKKVPCTFCEKIVSCAQVFYMATIDK